MITIFNRREVYCGFSMEESGRIRDILGSNQIRYTWKVEGPPSQGIFDAGRSFSGSIGIDMDHAYQYYIFVHEDDYEKAIYLINNKR